MELARFLNGFKWKHDVWQACVVCQGSPSQAAGRQVALQAGTKKCTGLGRNVKKLVHAYV